jgi:cytosine/adenosine deaminase-related metal-dependent hydrolase
MATVDGARALGLDRETGSLLPGKAADLVLIHRAFGQAERKEDPMAAVVYSCTPGDVTLVVVDGAIRFRRSGR